MLSTAKHRPAFLDTRRYCQHPRRHVHIPLPRYCAPRCHATQPAACSATWADRCLTPIPRVATLRIRQPFCLKPPLQGRVQGAPRLHHGRYRTLHRGYPPLGRILCRNLRNLDQARSTALRGIIQRRAQTRTPPSDGSTPVLDSSTPRRALVGSTSSHVLCTRCPRTSNPVCINPPCRNKCGSRYLHAAEPTVTRPPLQPKIHPFDNALAGDFNPLATIPLPVAGGWED